MVTMVEQSDWPIDMTRKFGYCPCSHHMADWCKENELYACYKNKNAMYGHSKKYCNFSKDHAPSSASKLESFIGHCNDFSV